MKSALILAVTLLVAASPRGRAAEGVDLYGDFLPPGAIARLGTIRYRHPGWGKRLTFLPDNQTLLAGFEGQTSEGTIRSWDARTGKLIHELDLGGDMLQAFCTSADGRRAATLSQKFNAEGLDGRVRLSIWNTITWREIHKFNFDEQPGMTPERMAFSPDQQLIAAGGMDGSVRIWDAETGRETKRRVLVRGDVRSLAFSPKEPLIAATGMDGVVLWEYAADAKPQKLPGLPRGGEAVVFSHDGALIAVGGGGDRAGHVYDVGSRKLLPRLQGASDDYYGQDLRFSPDDKRLIVPTNRARSVEVFDVFTGKLVETLDAGSAEPNAVAASADGQLIAGASGTALVVWDREAGESLSDRFVGHSESPSELAFTPDGQHIVTGSMDGTIRIWDAATGRQERVLQHEHWVAGLALSPDGRWLASCGLDDTVRLWETATGREVFKLPGHGRAGGSTSTEVAFSPDGTRFFTFGADMYLRTYGVDSGRVLAEHAIKPPGADGNEDGDGLRRPGGDPFGVFGRGGFALGQARFSGEAAQLLIGGRMGGQICAFAVEDGRQLDPIETELPPQDFAVSPDSAWLITFERPPAEIVGNHQRPNRTTMLRARDFATHATVREVVLPGSYAHQAAFSPDGRLMSVAISQYDNENPNDSQRVILVLDLQTLSEVAHVDDPSHAPTFMAFSPDGARLAVAEEDSSVTVWDLEQVQRNLTTP